MAMAAARKPQQRDDRPHDRIVTSMVSVRAVWILGASAVLAAAAAASAFAGVARATNPAAALKIWPLDAQAPAALADLRIKQDPGFATARSAAALAVMSLRRQAVNPAALRIAGLYESSAGRQRKAVELMRLAAAQTRRDLPTQLWSIEDRIQKEDLAGALRHYDIAMRTLPEARAILYPILARAIDDGAVRQALLPFIRANPPWMHDFIAEAAGPAYDPAVIAQAIRVAGGFPPGVAYRPLQTRLLSRLIEQNNSGEARRLYLALEGSSPRGLADPGFLPETIEERFVPLSWLPIVLPTRGASLEAPDGSGKSKAHVYAEPDDSGAVLSRVMMIGAGTYRFQLSNSAEGSPSASITWLLTCGADPSQILWRSANIHRSGVVRFDGITIPASCPYQRLSLMVDGGRVQPGLQATIANVRLVPAVAAEASR